MQQFVRIAKFRSRYGAVDPLAIDADRTAKGLYAASVSSLDKLVHAESFVSIVGKQACIVEDI